MLSQLLTTKPDFQERLIIMKKVILLLFFASFAAWHHQQSGTVERLRAVSIVNKNTVWASGNKGTFTRTTDGGKSWTSGIVVGAEELDFRDVEAFDQKRAYLLSIGQGEMSRIYATEDGGKNWKLLYKNRDPKAFFDGFAFWDSNNAVAFGDPVDGKLLVIKTTDGGKNWQKVENIPDSLPEESAFAASGTSIVTEGKSNAWIATGGSAARVFRSTDRGSSWVVSSTPIISGNESSGIFSLAFRDALHGVAVGGDYKEPDKQKQLVAITNDGGVSWKLANKQPGGYRSSVSYVSSYRQKTSLVAVGPNGSDYSTDDGLTWHKLSEEGFHSVDFQNFFGWAVGDAGRIYHQKID